jgi:hypothetical protein
MQVVGENVYNILSKEERVDMNGCVYVGRSTVTTQTGKPLKKTLCFLEAEKLLPSLSDYGLPSRTSDAERTSFYLQASKRKLVQPPSNVNRNLVLEKLLPRYPKFMLSYSSFNDKKFDDELNHCIDILKLDASPGVPYMALAKDNKALLESRDLVKTLVKDRIQIRLNTPNYRSMDQIELVQKGLCDPVRLFIKDELHKITKIQEGRLRLIMSVSTIDKLIEMVLIRRIKELEVDNWFAIPSVPGLGFTDEMSKILYQRVHNMAKPVSSDVSGWDWSCQQWLHEDAAEFTIMQCINPNSDWIRLIRMDAYIAGHSLYSTSDGDLYTLTIPGNINSGRFQTSRGNSLARNIVRMHVSDDLDLPNESLSMGDDCIEDEVENAQAKYASLGITVKVYDKVDKDFEFCSRIFTEKGSYPANPQKLLGNILMTNPRTHGELMTYISAFETEMVNHPQYPFYANLLASVGYLKLGGEQNINFEDLYYQNANKEPSEQQSTKSTKST